MINEIKIPIGKNGDFISGTLFKAQEDIAKGRSVLIMHGRTSSQKKWIARAKKLQASGINCLTFDFRGHGKSSGSLEKNKLSDAIIDMKYSLDFLLSQNFVNPNRIGIVGTSFSASIIYHLFKKIMPKAIVLRVPAVYSSEWENESYTFIDKNREDVTKFRASDKILKSPSIMGFDKYLGDLLILGAEKDNLVSQNVLKYFYEKSIKSHSKKILIIPKAGHSFNEGNTDNLACEAMNELFLEYL